MEMTDTKKYTIEEFFNLVEEAEYKLEYYRGRVYAMAGAKANHNIIAGNLIAVLNNELLDKECTVFTSDQAVTIGNHAYFYPDVMVGCDALQLDDTQTRLLNPILIIEILSKSTRGFDKDRKFGLYQEISSLKEYVLINSEAYSFQSFYREQGDLWRISSGDSLDQIIPLYSLDLKIPLERIYKKILPFENK